jgi:hypothetical protein
MYELDGDVPDVRARLRRFAQGDEATATRKALGHLVTEARGAVRLGLEEAPIGLGPALERALRAR